LLKRNEIRKLVDVTAFFDEINRMVVTYDCTYLDALEEYSRIHDVSLDFVANIVKTHKGKVKTNLTEQCRTLNLVSE